MERATESEPLHAESPTRGHGYLDDPRPNVVRHLVIRHGDPEVEGEVAVSGVYGLGSQDQAFLGPESGLAVPDGISLFTLTPTCTARFARTVISAAWPLVTCWSVSSPYIWM